MPRQTFDTVDEVEKAIAAIGADRVSTPSGLPDGHFAGATLTCFRHRATVTVQRDGTSRSWNCGKTNMAMYLFSKLTLLAD